MNVIIYNNTTELDGENSSTYTIDYSDVKGCETFGAWATGSGNIDADPLFVGSGDYNLQNGSPCIDTGNPGVQYNDIDGSRNDMGAYGGPNGDRKFVVYKMNNDDNKHYFGLFGVLPLPVGVEGV